MNDHDSTKSYQIYPRRYFDLAPTWFAWNRITVADVYRLREENGFQGQGIYFWANNPIQFVRLVGVYLGAQLIGEARIVLMVIDDCSGANIEVKILQRRPEQGHDEQYPSNTLIDNVNVETKLDTLAVQVDNHVLSPGSVVMVKGTIVKFRDQRQILLKRIFLVEDTNTEAKHWAQAAEWKRTKLSQPWLLTKEQQTQFDEAEARKLEQERKTHKSDRKRSSKAIEKAAEAELKRARIESEMNAGALPGTDLIPDNRPK